MSTAISSSHREKPTDESEVLLCRAIKNEAGFGSSSL